MRKIRFDLEKLKVDSFLTDGSAVGRRTVQGYESPVAMPSITCPPPDESQAFTCYDIHSATGGAGGCICPNLRDDSSRCTGAC